MSNASTVREWAEAVSYSNSRPRGLSVSYGEPIALRGQMELEQVASAAPVEVRENAETQFIERLKRGEAAAFDAPEPRVLELPPALRAGDQRKRRRENSRRCQRPNRSHVTPQHVELV